MDWILDSLPLDMREIAKEDIGDLMRVYGMKDIRFALRFLYEAARAEKYDLAYEILVKHSKGGIEGSLLKCILESCSELGIPSRRI